jgi:hypothetical protein
MAFRQIIDVYSENLELTNIVSRQNIKIFNNKPSGIYNGPLRNLFL